MKKVIVASIFLFLSLIAYFANDYFFSDENSAESFGDPLATVQGLKNEVRSKHESTYFWNEAKKGDVLYDGSEIHTGSNSESELKFNDGKSTLVPAETLLKLKKEKGIDGGDILSLNLEAGSLQVMADKAGGQPLQVKIGNKKLQLGAKDRFGVLLKKEKEGMFITPTAGEVEIKGLAGKERLKPGEQIVISAPAGEAGSADAVEGEALSYKELEAVVLRPKEPSGGVTIFEQDVRFFEWEAPADKSLHIQVAPDFYFSSILKQFDVTGKDRYVIPVDQFNSGDHYWRLVANQEKAPQYSVGSHFYVKRSTAAKMAEPVLRFKDRNLWQVELNSKESLDSSYHFQVSKNTGFDPLYDEYEGKLPLKTELKEPGTYYIRGRQKMLGGVYSDWSEPVKQVIREPLQDVSVEVLSEQLNAKGEIELDLKWNKIPHAVDYLIQIGETPEFKKILKNTVTKTPPYTLTHVVGTAGYLRVLGRSIEGEYSPHGTAPAVKGLLKGPVITTKELLPQLLDDPNSSRQLHLTWERRSAAQRYRVEISRDVKLSSPRSEVTDRVEFFGSLPEDGVYFYRIWSLGDNSRYFMVPTPIYAGELRKVGSLLTPKIFLPKANEMVLVPSGMAVSMQFTWSEVPEAKWFDLEMAQSEDFKKNRQYFKVPDNKFLLSKRISNGQWFYRIRARNPYQTSEWTNKGVFHFGSSK